MKFRDFEIAEIVVVEDTDRTSFVKRLGELMGKVRTIDVQYSTRVIRKWGELTTVWSALVLVGVENVVEWTDVNGNKLEIKTERGGVKR